MTYKEGLKLWVDDIRNPVSFVGEGWHWAKTVTEAIRILDTMSVSELSLDHDISMKVSVGYGDARPFCSPETFEPIARFVAHVYEPEQIKITLHTANAEGARKMAEILHRFNVTIKLSQPCNRFEEDHEDH